MSNSVLSLAIQDLLKYFSYSGRRDAIAKSISKSTGVEANMFLPSIPLPGIGGPPSEEEPKPTKPTPEQIRYVLDIITNTTDGGVFTHSIIKKLSGAENLADVEDFIDKVIKVYYEPSSVESPVPSFIGKKNDGSTPCSIRSITSTGVASESEFSTSEGVAAGTNVNPSDPNKFLTPALSAIVLPGLEIGVSTRNTDAVSLFMNAIPTTQMSLCSPFIDLRIITDRPMLGDIVSPGEGKINDVSLMKFLGVYSVKNDSKDPNFILASASPKGLDLSSGIDSNPLLSALGLAGEPSNEEAEPPSANISNAGMELFTAPQTLVNPLINQERAGSGMPNVLDPMAPLATLESISFSDQLSGQGMIGFSRASVKIRLHDRSRMPEMAVLMNPQTFSLGSFILEYGWSHPHALLNNEIGPNNTQRAPNPYANFLNSLRTRMKYKLVTSDFSLSSDGQVVINLNMIGMAAASIPQVHISEGAFVNSRTVKYLLERLINQALSAVDTNVKNVEIMPKQVLTSVEKLTDTTLVPRQTFIDVITSFERKSAEAGSDIESIRDFVRDQLDKIVDDSAAAPVNAKSEVKKKLRALENLGKVGDPWLVDLNTGANTTSIPQFRSQSNVDDTGDGAIPPESPGETLTGTEESGSEESFKGFASLAKIIMSFIGQPLAATHKHDEVQVLFYGFNALAGPFSNYTVANYPIDVAAFSTQVKKLLSSPQSLTIAKMMSVLSDIVSNPSEDPYGFGSAYGSKFETSSEEKPEIPEEDSIRMSEMNILRSHFTAPELKFFIETVPDIEDNISSITGTYEDSSGNADSSGSNRKKVPGKEICRIHVYDGNAHPYGSTSTLLDVISSDEFASFYKQARATMSETEIPASPTPDPSIDQQSNNPSEMNSEIARDEEEGVVEVVRDDNEIIEVMRQKADTETIKAQIRSQTPTIIYGTMFSPITQVDMKAATSGPVNNAIIGRAILKANSEKEGATEPPKHIPDMLVTPASLNIKCLGNPLIRHGQYYYVDMGTGTTADNLYVVTHVAHEISPGEFSTSFKLTYQGNKIEAIRNKLVSAYVVLNSLGDTTSET